MPLIWPQRTKNPGDTTVRLLDDMVQQQDSQGQWIDICTIQEFEQSDPVSAGRQKMEEIVKDSTRRRRQTERMRKTVDFLWLL